MFITEETTIWLEPDFYEEIRKDETPYRVTASKCPLKLKNGALRSVYQGGGVIRKRNAERFEIRRTEIQTAFQEWKWWIRRKCLRCVYEGCWGIETRAVIQVKRSTGRYQPLNIGIDSPINDYAPRYKPVTAKRWDGVDGWIKHLRHFGSFRRERANTTLSSLLGPVTFVVATQRRRVWWDRQTATISAEEAQEAATGR